MNMLPGTERAIYLRATVFAYSAIIIIGIATFCAAALIGWLS
ncbi:hypothetical protein [Devosia sp. DBB001]|nr:hypothetical protein [Devosia sp. DBB001]